MDIDWIVSIAAFLVFASWSIFFYTSITLPVKPLSLESSLLDVNEKVIDYLSIGSYSSNIRVNATVPDSNSPVFVFNYTWPAGKNTTRIFNGSGVQKDCIMFANNGSVYFQGNVSSGNNYFTATFREEETALNCTGTFTIVNESAVVPWVAERSDHISLANILAMNTTPYRTFKNNISVEGEFRLEINISGEVTNYGLALPQITNVYATTHTNKIEETGQNITIRVMSWQ